MGFDGAVDEDWDTIVDVCSDEVAFVRGDPVASVEFAAVEVVVSPSNEADSVAALGELVVRLGRLESPLVGSDSCRIWREVLSGMDAPKGSAHPRRSSKATWDGRIVYLIKWSFGEECSALCAQLPGWSVHKTQCIDGYTSTSVGIVSRDG